MSEDHIPRYEVRRPDGTVLAVWLGETTFHFAPERTPRGDVEFWRDDERLAVGVADGTHVDWSA